MTKKKILSMVLTLCMVVSFLPTITLSAGATGSGSTLRTTTLDLTSTALSYISTTGAKILDATDADITDSAEGWSANDALTITNGTITATGGTTSSLQDLWMCAQSHKMHRTIC